MQESFPHLLMILERFVQLLADEVNLYLPFLAKIVSYFFPNRELND